MVSRASAGMIGGLVSGVALAVQVPIASTCVVSLAAAAISTASAVEVFWSDTVIRSFIGLVVRRGAVSIDGLVDSPGGWANRAAGLVAIKTIGKTPTQARLIQALTSAITMHLPETSRFHLAFPSTRSFRYEWARDSRTFLF